MAKPSLISARRLPQNLVLTESSSYVGRERVDVAPLKINTAERDLEVGLCTSSRVQAVLCVSEPSRVEGRAGSSSERESET